MTYYETSRPDWGMDAMYRREELRDAEIAIEERREDDNRKNFELFHAQIMQHVIKEAYEFRKCAIECDDLEYSQNDSEWRTFLLDGAEVLELSSNKYENEEIKDALIWATQSNHAALQVSKIDELANQWKVRYYQWLLKQYNGGSTIDEVEELVDQWKGRACFNF